MSEIKSVQVSPELVEKLKFISKNIKKLNVGGKSELWLATDPDSEGGYEWDQFDIGVNDKGELITCHQSGCSCNGPEAPEAGETYPLVGEINAEFESYYSQGKGLIAELTEVTETLYSVLKKKPANAETIIKLPNAEIRRAIIELIGMEKFIKSANPQVIDKNEAHGELLKISLEGDEDMVLLYVKDPSTTREYFLRVPPSMKNSAQARAWTFGFDETDFHPDQET